MLIKILYLVCSVFGFQNNYDKNSYNQNISTITYFYDNFDENNYEYSNLYESFYKYFLKNDYNYNHELTKNLDLIFDEKDKNIDEFLNINEIKNTNNENPDLIYDLNFYQNKSNFEFLIFDYNYLIFNLKDIFIKYLYFILIFSISSSFSMFLIANLIYITMKSNKKYLENEDADEIFEEEKKINISKKDLYENSFITEFEELDNEEITNERLELIEDMFLSLETPKGLIHISYDKNVKGFIYYAKSSSTFSHNYLDCAARQFVIEFNCKQLYNNLHDEILSSFNKITKISDISNNETNFISEDASNDSFDLKDVRYSNTPSENDDVFLVSKNYNKNSEQELNYKNNLIKNNPNRSNKNKNYSKKNINVIDKKCNKFIYKGNLFDYDKKYNKVNNEEVNNEEVNDEINNEEVNDDKVNDVEVNDEVNDEINNEEVNDVEVNNVQVNDVEVNDIEVNDIEVNDVKVNDVKVNDTEVNDVKVNDTEVNDDKVNNQNKKRKVQGKVSNNKGINKILKSNSIKNISFKEFKKNLLS